MPPREYIPKILIVLTLLLSPSISVNAQSFKVIYHLTDKDTQVHESPLKLQSVFDSREKALEYIGNLKSALGLKGYSNASIDSLHADSARASVFLYLGNKLQWRLHLDSLSPVVRNEAGIGNKKGEILVNDYNRVAGIENKILNYYENRGFPFVKLSREKSNINKEEISTFLKVDPGVLYHIDSIKIFGKGKIRNNFMQHYLGISDGDVYNKSKLEQVSKLIADLPFLQEQNPWSLTMLGTGATLNLFLQPRRSSEVNALIGFLPGNSITGKTKITADVRLNLKNALGGGETLLLNWQQLQAQSPRLDLGLNLPYLFNTPYGIDASFGLLKQDSSWLLLTGKIGIQYFWNAHKSVQVFYQMRNSYLLQGGFDTTNIILTKRLPQFIDVRSSAAGLTYHLENTDYSLNPRRGNVLLLSATAGIRKVTPNDEITQLKDPADPDFDFHKLYDTVNKKSYVTTVNFSESHFFPVGKKNTLKLSADAGWLQSPQVFQNELFRIGGYELLRGFDEKSIYADRYGVASMEYRALTGINSYLFLFSDFGLTHTTLGGAGFTNSFISGGLGLKLETKVGLLNIAYAVGKRDDVKFNFRNASKIHFGYINYF